MFIDLSSFQISKLGLLLVLQKSVFYVLGRKQRIIHLKNREFIFKMIKYWITYIFKARIKLIYFCKITCCVFMHSLFSSTSSIDRQEYRNKRFCISLYISTNSVDWKISMFICNRGYFWKSNQNNKITVINSYINSIFYMLN